MSDNEQPQMPVPHPALKQLDFLVGKWETKGGSEAGPMGPAGKINTIETFEWLGGGFFLVHHWEGTFDFGDQAMPDVGYEFIDYDAETNQFRTHYFNNLGPYQEAMSTYQGGFQDGALVLIGPARVIRKLNAEGGITCDSDISLDGGETWTPFMQSSMTRIK